MVRTPEHEQEARRLSRTNFPDALHVVLARALKADCIITRNLEDFLAFSALIDIRLPERL